MHVLFLTGHLPYPPVSGGRRREFELLKRLASDVRFHVVAVSKTPAEDGANAAELARRLGGRVTVLAARACGEGPRQVIRHTCPDAADVVADADDVVHVEGFYLMQHVPVTCAARVLLVEQNVEWELWRQRATSARPRERGTRRSRRGVAPTSAPR